MPAVPKLAAVLTLLAICIAATRGQSSDDALADMTSEPPPSVAPHGEFRLNNLPDSTLQRLPLSDDRSVLDPAQFVEDSEESISNVRDSAEDHQSPFVARIWWLPKVDLKDGTGDLAMNGEEIEVGFPLRIESDSVWLALGSAERLEISTSAIFPNSGLAVPDQLWDIQVGTMYVRELGDRRRAGGIVRIGSPSDQPFAALRDMTVTLVGFWTIPSGPRDAWNLSLFYSPTGQIVFPIPGLTYAWRPSDRFQADLGVPFSFTYHPTETLTLTAHYRPLTDGQALIRQQLGPSWIVYGGYRTVNETFLLADRLDDRLRTYLFDQRVVLGVQRQLGSGWNLDLSAAYVFDRQLFQAKKFSGNRRDELAIDPGLAGTLLLSWSR